MNKSNFNKLSLVEQVSYFNDKLKEGYNITEICGNLNISYNTVRDRFTKGNYTFNKLNKQYECVEKMFPLDEELIERALEKVVIKVFNNTSNNKESNSYKCDLTIYPNVPDEKVVNRSFRVYKSVLDDFIKFCSASNANQYDILSTFISEGIERYSQNM